ncbi:transient receptor potential cation channel protein painless-like [Bradysia coprophila]|uniref:transient receptor potential cation channel protein painless-like n=1 Tax=Bradysia coprophila TaxID=38358 RepID=UPI00187D8172|nr:transient receptor potential cation channel protein painless-like [Bradysia coprophila]
MEELGESIPLSGLKDNKHKFEQFNEAFKWNDVDKFRQILSGIGGSDRVNFLQTADPYTHKSIFELICATPDRHTFILECISAGCDTNKQNQKCGKGPLGFAVEAISSNNLEALLSDTSVGVDTKHSFQFPFTSVNYFVELISDKSFNEIYPCIELLVKHCADVNLPAENGKTPIENILENSRLRVEKKTRLMQCFLSEAKYVDITRVYTRLIKLLPDVELSPTHTQIDQVWNADRFVEYLTKENELKIIATDSPTRLTELFTIVHSDTTLLTLAIENAWTFSVEKVIRLGVDLNIKAGHFTPIEHAINVGHWEILQLFLSSSKLDLNGVQTLLPIAAQYTERPANNHKNYVKCFDLLLNHSKIDVNAADAFGCTALHYAIRNDDSRIVADLLKRGAYIGIKDSSKKPLISKIDPQLLEKHFNSCITTTSKHFDRNDYELVFNFANFIPSQSKRQKGRYCVRKRIYETKVLRNISECDETKHLVRHPLIEGLLHWKLDGFNVILFANLLFFALFAVNTVWTIYWFNNANQNGKFKKCEMPRRDKVLFENIYWVCSEESAYHTYYMSYSFLMLSILFAREVTQFIFSPWSYLKSLDNYLELALIFCSFVTIGMQHAIIEFHDRDAFDDEGRMLVMTVYKTLAVASIFLITYEMFCLLGTVPFWSFSTHYVMLKTVVKNFFKCLLMYAIIIVAFAFTFYILFNDPTNSTNPSTIATTPNSTEGKLNHFSSVGMSLFKVSTMAIGEIDAASIDFKGNATSYVVFAGFILLITTVLSNLLNGLAVSDTTAIMAEAKQTELIQRCAALSRFEDGLFNIANRIGFTKLKSNVIRVRPNQKNRIVGENQKKCCGSARMSESIVKEAFKVLKRAELEEKEEIEKERIERRFSNIEKSINSIESLVKSNEKLLEKVLQHRLN